MEKKIISGWETEIISFAVDVNCFFVAVFSTDGTLLFANTPMEKLLSDEPKKKLLNPDFEKLCTLPVGKKSLVFEGHCTIGSYSVLNISLLGKVYRKNDQFLIIASENASDLQQQNQTLLLLNREINNLQRQLIREKQQLEIALNKLDETNHKLKNINLQKDKFFSVIAHDLRSPFNSILGFSEILKENYQELTPDQIKNYSQHIYQSTNTTYNLLVNLLEWASLQRNVTHFNPQKINFNQLFEEVQALLIEQAIQKEISIRLSCPVNLEWVADKNMVTSILRNLVSNAIKFSHQGGKIEISTVRKDSFLEISVSDYGTGMRSKVVNSLFSNEFNESKKGTDNEKGSGLGLILCHEFVEKHGGKLLIDSKLNHGTTIRFTLPQKSPAME